VGGVGVRAGCWTILKAAEIRPALAMSGEPTEMRIVGAHKAGGVIETIARRPRRPFERAFSRRQRGS